MSLQSSETFEPDNLFAGTQVASVVADAVNLQAGQGVLVRGTVLGKLDADDECVIIDSSTEGTAAGSGVVYAILSEDTDTGDEAGTAVPAPAYFTGEFNERELVFGGTDTADDHRDAAKKIGIFFKDTIAK